MFGARASLLCALALALALPRPARAESAGGDVAAGPRAERPAARTPKPVRGNAPRRAGGISTPWVLAALGVAAGAALTFVLVGQATGSSGVRLAGRAP